MAFEKECAASLNAYLRIYPGSFFGRPLKTEEVALAKNALVCAGFETLAPLAASRKDYYSILWLVQHDVEGFFAMLSSGDRKALECRFADARKAADAKALDKFQKFYKQEEKKV